MLRRYYADCKQLCSNLVMGTISFPALEFSRVGQAAVHTVERVDAAGFAPRPLSDSLAEFEGVLSSKQVQNLPDAVQVNGASFQTLLHFLTRYTKGLRKDEPLQQQLHALEFVVPDTNDSQSLRRVVVRVGTPGGSNGHSIVSRCIQGLFREVGISPNFVWDKGFEIPERYISHEQRKRLESAALDEKVKHIQAAQRGEQLPSGSQLKVINSTDVSNIASNAKLPGLNSVTVKGHSGADRGMLTYELPTSTGSASASDNSSEYDSHVASYAEEDEDESLDTILTVAAHLDEQLRLLAMSPWIRAYGELRAEEERNTANDIIMYMTGMLPGFGTVVPHVWEGEEVDVRKLAEELSQGHTDDMKNMVAACVQQLCDCFEALVQEHGAPDPNRIVERKLLVQTTSRIAVASAHARTVM
eukprot:jgi/Ulvmu1/12491/UM009_0144.1